MLMQLVCVDRRYQRMNCFNIRELQGVLKRKFFTDLINTNDHRDFLNQSMIGLRFKSNNNISLVPEVEAFFNLGTTFDLKSKNVMLNNTYSSLNFMNNFNNIKRESLSLSIHYLMYIYLESLFSLFTSLSI